MKKKRDEARRRAEQLEKRAEGKTTFVREWLLNNAKMHRQNEWACNAVLGRHT
jgi:hypothetical protein